MTITSAAELSYRLPDVRVPNGADPEVFTRSSLGDGHVIEGIAVRARPARRHGRRGPAFERLNIELIEREGEVSGHEFTRARGSFDIIPTAEGRALRFRGGRLLNGQVTHDYEQWLAETNRAARVNDSIGTVLACTLAPAGAVPHEVLQSLADAVFPIPAGAHVIRGNTQHKIPG